MQKPMSGITDEAAIEAHDLIHDAEEQMERVLPRVLFKQYAANSWLKEREKRESFSSVQSAATDDSAPERNKSNKGNEKGALMGRAIDALGLNKE